MGLSPIKPKPHSRYYRYPEGTDFVGKWLTTTSYALPVGFVNGLVDTYFYTHPKGYGPTMYRILFHTFPLVGMSTAFVTATYISTNLRKKDDRLNYFIGGLAAGSVFGTWVKCAGKGLGMGVFLGLAGILKKDVVDSGFEFFPQVQHQYSSLHDHHLDLSVTRYVPGNWTTGRAEDQDRP